VENPKGPNNTTIHASRRTEHNTRTTYGKIRVRHWILFVERRNRIRPSFTVLSRRLSSPGASRSVVGLVTHFFENERYYYVSLQGNIVDSTKRPLFRALCFTAFHRFRVIQQQEENKRVTTITTCRLLPHFLPDSRKEERDDAFLARVDDCSQWSIRDQNENQSIRTARA
jgi:hypothetical protein